MARSESIFVARSNLNNDSCRFRPVANGFGMYGSLLLTILEYHRTRRDFRHVPGVTTLVLGDPHLEGARLRAVGLRLAHVRAAIIIGLLGVDLGCCHRQEHGDVAGNGPGALGATEEFKEFEESAGGALEHQETGAIHAHRVLFLAFCSDFLERIAGGIVVGDNRFLVTQVECLEATGQRENVDAVSQLDDLLIRLGNPVGARRDKSLVDGVPLAEQLQATEELGVPRHLLELFIGAELGGRKLGEIDGG